MVLIEFTTPAGKKVLINPKHVTYLKPVSETRCSVHFTGMVKEEYLTLECDLDTAGRRLTTD